MGIDAVPQCECYKAGRPTGKCGKTNAGWCSCTPHHRVKVGFVPPDCKNPHTAVNTERVAALKRMGYREGSVWFNEALKRE